jgi:3-deoxy-D-manno-octulosonic-acid transferase
VVVVNGRLTQRSFKRYRLLKPLIQPSFSRLSFVGAQNDAYAERFIALGVDDRRISVTGTMKWDTAQSADDVPGEQELAAEMGIDLTIPIVVAGSTAPDEHVLVREAVPPTVQLLCAPRKPEWCEAAAADLPGCIRRSQHKSGSFPPSKKSRFFLLDTIGELRKAYGLADVVIIGRSFGKLHGSDLMEPVALGKPTIIGPAMDDFQDSAEALLANDGVVQTTRESLPLVIEQLLSDPVRRRQLAVNGREVIRSQQGATERSAQIILDQLVTTGTV